jgi:outer membrane protein insertion porin family
MLALVSALIGLPSVCAQSNEYEGCKLSSTDNPQSLVIVIDSVEFQDDVGLTPEIRGRLLDDFKRENLHASTAADMDWRDGLAEKVRLALQEQGYFKVLVDVTSGLIRAEAQRLHYWVSVQAETGPQFRLREVKFENTAEFSLSKLRAQVPLKEGDLFSVPKVREALDNLRRLYGTLGYVDFTAEPQTDIDDDVHRIDLTLKLDVGRQYRVRSVTIHGFDATVDKRLRSKFEAGQVFDSTAVNHFFESNSAVLPNGASAESSVSIVRDVQNGLVDLVFEPHRCSAP